MREPESWLSVVTVVKDDAAGFERTRTSLVDQVGVSVEHIVIDSSQDETAIPDLISKLEQPWIIDRYTWEPAQGIYPAMNAGLHHAHGRYVYFLNAGDELLEPTTLSRVCELLLPRSPIWAFGEIEIHEMAGDIVTTRPWNYECEKRWAFSRGRFPAHQATFTQTQILKDLGGFSSGYTVAADYEMFLRLSSLADPLYLDMVVARFAEGGISTHQWRRSLREFHRARKDILAPSSSLAVRERWGTWQQRLTMEAYRAWRSLRSLI